jgi:hypothetical protein
MLSWFRLQAPRIAAVAMCSLASAGLSAVTPHADDCHDTACGLIGVQHNEDDHRFETVPAAVDQDFHCLVCHWTRSFRAPVATPVLLAPAVLAGALPPLDADQAARPTQAAQPPLRSPPSRLLDA